MNDLDKILEKRLVTIKNSGRFRTVIPVAKRFENQLQIMDRDYLNLSGNDYLGLVGNKKLIQDFYSQLDTDNCLEKFSTGAGASRLMTGNSELYREVENRIAALYQKDRCLIFNSGYHINIGILPAITGKKDLIIADKLCHASLIDGMRLSRADVIRFHHNDYDHLETLLKKNRSNYDQVFLVSESVFSMDGDTCDLQKLVQLKIKYKCFLLIDEAHAVGIIGPKGLGLAEELGVLPEIDIFIGTFGKAFGGQGGYTVCSNNVAEFLINTARSLIFTTGLPPVNLSWLLFILDKFPDMAKERLAVRQLSIRLRDSLRENNIVTSGSTHIVPIFIGDSLRAVVIAQKLRQKGFWVSAVRPPTVPEGSARLRLSVSASMTWDDIEPLPKLIKDTMDTLNANQHN